MPDGEKVETVLIPQLGDERIVTQCISSQVGCAMGCVFCASGVAGLKRQMTDAEIVAQVLLRPPRGLGPTSVSATWFSWGWASRCTTMTRSRAPSFY